MAAMKMLVGIRGAVSYDGVCSNRVGITSSEAEY